MNREIYEIARLHGENRGLRFLNQNEIREMLDKEYRRLYSNFDDIHWLNDFELTALQSLVTLEEQQPLNRAAFKWLRKVATGNNVAGVLLRIHAERKAILLRHMKLPIRANIAYVIYFSWVWVLHLIFNAWQKVKAGEPLSDAILAVVADARNKKGFLAITALEGVKK
jgi:hypothetical protein